MIYVYKLSQTTSFFILMLWKTDMPQRKHLLETYMKEKGWGNPLHHKGIHLVSLPKQNLLQFRSPPLDESSFLPHSWWMT